ncbi:MAG: RNA methyltransferase [Nitrosomonas sp.]|nr:RNA methyltransferase [Nitrosomonas sp.]
MQRITSTEHTYVKQLVKLQKSARFRRKSGVTILDGIHLIQSYLSAYHVPSGLKSLVISESGQKNKEITAIQEACSRHHETQFYFATDNLFQKISSVKTPTGILACVAIPEPDNPFILANNCPNFCILLETIQDPGNLGTIIRCAAAADITDIFLSQDCVDAWSPKVLRAAMGAHFFLNIYADCNLVEIANCIQGQVLATSPYASRTLYQMNLNNAAAFIFGNEGTGLSNEILHAADEIISIPMPGKTESLNAAAATAICLFEKVRQDQQVYHSES